MKTGSIKKIRYHLQWALFLFVIYCGYEFFGFYRHFISHTPFIDRPTMIDGFLPIGALLSLRLWFSTGILHPVHPAATVILFAALSVSVFFRKSFCGWICPIGTLSELIYKIGRKILSRNIEMNRFLDYFLRSVKYLFLCMIIYLSFFKMDAQSIAIFLNNLYWKIADVKMLLLFINISKVSITVLIVLFFSSLFIKKFWCRYVCPYGALTGLIGLLSPFKIIRNSDSCVQCKKCSQSCPNLIPIDRMSIINSPECNGCLTCISVCPSSNTLRLSFWRIAIVKPITYFLAVYILFFGIIGMAKITGNWKSQVSYETYKKIIPVAGQIGH